MQKNFKIGTYIIISFDKISVFTQNGPKFHILRKHITRNAFPVLYLAEILKETETIDSRPLKKEDISGH